MAISEGEMLELAQSAPVLVKDSRTTGSQMWVTDFIHRREVVDSGEAVIIQTRLGLAGNYPTNPLPTVSWTIIQRIPEVTV